jgi:hypothetical protein
MAASRPVSGPASVVNTEPPRIRHVVHVRDVRCWPGLAWDCWGVLGGLQPGRKPLRWGLSITHEPFTTPGLRLLAGRLLPLSTDLIQQVRRCLAELSDLIYYVLAADAWHLDAALLSTPLYVGESRETGVSVDQTIHGAHAAAADTNAPGAPQLHISMS